MKVDTSLIPFGDYGSFEFRTREPQGRLLLIQLLDGPRQLPGGSVEFLIFADQLQVTTRFQFGMHIKFIFYSHFGDSLIAMLILLTATLASFYKF